MGHSWLRNEDTPREDDMGLKRPVVTHVSKKSSSCPNPRGIGNVLNKSGACPGHPLLRWSNICNEKRILGRQSTMILGRQRETE